MIQENALPAPRTCGNENTGLLKVIAIVCMIIDHVGAVFFPQIPEMRLIGRIAFPLFIWCVAVGTEYTRNIWLYALRLLIVGILSQPCFMLGLGHRWDELSIFATLLMGVLGIAGIRQRWFGSHIWGPIAALLVSCIVKMDYGWQGVAAILLFYLARKNRGGLAAAVVAYCLYWGQGTFSLTRVFGIPLSTRISFLPQAGTLLYALTRVQFWAVLALPLMLIPMKGRLRLPKWAGYAAYPVHLLIIGAIRTWLM